MKGSAKLLIASFIILACSIGFFAGAISFGCNKVPMPCEKGMMTPPHGDFSKKHHAKAPHGPKDFKPNFAELDSILQVTPEQKAALDQQRTSMDSSFKVLRKQKMEAEKMLKEALDSENLEQIKTAKANILAANEALLNQRIEGAENLSKILSKEQMAKFHEFQKEKFQKFHKGPHDREHSPRHHEKGENVEK